jgi:hypothetical protein
MMMDHIARERVVGPIGRGALAMFGARGIRPSRGGAEERAGNADSDEATKNHRATVRGMATVVERQPCTSGAEVDRSRPQIDALPEKRPRKLPT